MVRVPSETPTERKFRNRKGRGIEGLPPPHIGPRDEPTDVPTAQPQPTTRPEDAEEGGRGLVEGVTGPFKDIASGLSLAFQDPVQAHEQLQRREEEIKTDPLSALTLEPEEEAALDVFDVAVSGGVRTGISRGARAAQKVLGAKNIQEGLESTVKPVNVERLREGVQRPQVVGEGVERAFAVGPGGEAAREVPTITTRSIDESIEKLSRSDVPDLEIPGGIRVSGNNPVGLRPPDVRLSVGQRLTNVVRSGINKTGLNWTLDDPTVTGILNERARVQDVAANHANRANAVAQAFLRPINRVTRGGARLMGLSIEKPLFEVDEADRIPALTGIDPTVPGAPTIQDVAARLPRYQGHLSARQLQGLETLRNMVDPYSNMLRNFRPTLGTRGDVMDGGFYIARGPAAVKGAEAPTGVSPARRTTGGAKGFEKAEDFGSMAEGLDDGWEYAKFEDAVAGYIKDAGNRAADLHAASWFKELGEPETMEMRLPEGLSNRVNKLRLRIGAARKTQRDQLVRLRGAGKEAVRREKEFTEAQRKIPDDPAFEQQALNEARAEVRASIEQWRQLSRMLGENAETLRTARQKLKPHERELLERMRDLDTVIDEAQNTARTGDPAFADLAGAVERMERQAQPLINRVNQMGQRVDDLVRRGEVLRGMDDEARRNVTGARQVERAQYEQWAKFNSANREIKMLEAEANRAFRRQQRAGAQSEKLAQRFGKTQTRLKGLKDELASIEYEWKKAQERARSPRRGTGPIGLSGLEGHAFPDALASAANRRLNDELPIQGANAAIMGTVNFLESMYRMGRATLDNSAMGIQGLLLGFRNPAAFAKATRVNLLSWGDKSVRGQYLMQYDRNAAKVGAPNVEDWGRAGLRLRGGDTEFSTRRSKVLDLTLGRVPGIQQANRAFGAFGDSARLEWAQAEFLKERALGRTPDMEQISQAVNGATGWSGNRAGGSLGDLLLFAPRFLQARLETLTRGVMGLSPGASLKNRIARRAMLQFVGTGAMLTFGINAMLGNETDTRPIVDGRYNSNFMRIRAGGRDWSLFGTWDSLARLLVESAMGRPHEAIRGLGGGIVTNAWDLISGTTAIGEPVPQDPAGATAHVLKNLVPFAATEIPFVAERAEEGEVGSAALTTVGEVFGWKSSPLSLSDLREMAKVSLLSDFEAQGLRDVRGEPITADTKFEVLPETAQDMINQAPEVEERLEEFEPALPSERLKRNQNFARWQEVKQQQESQVADAVQAGQRGNTLRETVQDFKKERYMAGNVLFNGVNSFEKDDPTDADFLRDLYHSVPAPYNPETGERDYEFKEDEQAKVLERAKQAGISEDFIKDKGLRFENPTVEVIIEQWEEDQDLLQVYWQGSREFIAERLPDEQRGILKQYQLASSAVQAKMRSQFPFLSGVTRQLSAVREQYRRRSPETDAALIRWGYATRPVTQEGVDEFEFITGGR